MIDFDQIKEYESVRNIKCIGFAELYLKHFNEKNIDDSEIDIQVYTKLVELDTRLGTMASEQLVTCLLRTNRSDIIKVRILIWSFNVVSIKTFNFAKVDGYWSTKNDNSGFAEVYLQKYTSTREEFDSDRQIDTNIYAELLALDLKLGTLASRQLFVCIYLTIEWKIIKV